MAQTLMAGSPDPINTILDHWRGEGFAWPHGRLLWHGGLRDCNEYPKIEVTSGQGTWRLTTTQAGSVESFLTLDPAQSGGVLVGTQQANNNDVLSLFANHGYKLSEANGNFELRFAARWYVSDVDDVDWHIGAGVYAADYNAAEAADWMGFQLKESEANGGLNVRYGKGSAYGGSSNVLTLADSTYVRTLFEYKPDIGGDLDTGTLSWWIESNGSYSESTTHRTNGKFPDDVVLLPFFQHKNGAATAMTFGLDWLDMWVVRPAYVRGTG